MMMTKITMENFDICNNCLYGNYDNNINANDDNNNIVIKSRQQ